MTTNATRICDDSAGVIFKYLEPPIKRIKRRKKLSKCEKDLINGKKCGKYVECLWGICGNECGNECKNERGNECENECENEYKNEDFDEIAFDFIQDDLLYHTYFKECDKCWTEYRFDDFIYICDVSEKTTNISYIHRACKRCYYKIKKCYWCLIPRGELFDGYDYSLDVMKYHEIYIAAKKFIWLINI